MRVRFQASLISKVSKATIIKMVATTTGAANIANVVSILNPRAISPVNVAERGFVPKPVQNSNQATEG
jgi:hypothetical protein